MRKSVKVTNVSNKERYQKLMLSNQRRIEKMAGHSRTDCEPATTATWRKWKNKSERKTVLV